jgi:hypothetical protein
MGQKQAPGNEVLAGVDSMDAWRSFLESLIVVAPNPEASHHVEFLHVTTSFHVFLQGRKAVDTCLEATAGDGEHAVGRIDTSAFFA